MKSAVTLLPWKLALSLTNRCTTNCEFCYRRDTNLQPAYFPFERYKDLVNELAPDLRCLDFGGLGEPLLHKRFRDFAEYGRRVLGPDAILRLVTNGDLLTENLVRFLVELGFYSVWVSLNAATARTRAALMPGSDLDAVCSSIRALLHLRKRLGLRVPFMKVSFVITKNNYLEIEKFLDLACSLGVDIVVIQALDEALNARIYHEQIVPVAELTPILERVYQRIEGDQRVWCAPLWRFRPSSERILESGSYAVACGSSEGILEVFFTSGEVTFCPYMAAEVENCSLGNIFKQSALEIWNGERARRFRRSMQDPATVPVVCRKCLNYWNRRWIRS